MITLNQLRVRLARWLLPTMRADGENLFIPDGIETTRLERLGDKPAFAVLRFTKGEGNLDISVPITPAPAREIGNDLLDVADDAQGARGESIDISDNGATYGGP